MLLRLIDLDYTIACASGPERLRDRKVRLQMWKLNVLNTSRSDWISQGEHYSKVKVDFFPLWRNGECWPEEQKHTFFRDVSIYQKLSVNVKVGELTMNWFQELSVSLHPPVIRRSQEVCVCVWTDVKDVVDLCDLTSHQVEQSFAKHDLKCAGPRANAAVTLAGPSCQLSQRLMRSDSCGVPKTNQCCVR